MNRLLRVATLAAVVLVAAACGSDDHAAAAAREPELRYELLPWTKELTNDTLARTAVSPDDGSVRFAGAPAQVAGLKKGDVLLAGLSPTTPRGLLRIVVETRQEGGELVAVTRPAPIQAAFKSLHAKIPAPAVALDGAKTDPFSLAPQTKYTVGKSVGGGKSIDWRVFDQDGNRDTKDDQLYVSGEIVGKVSLMAYVDLDWLDDAEKIAEEIACFATAETICDADLPDVKLGVRAEAVASVSVDAEGAAAKKFESDEIPIDGTNVDLPPLTAGPVVIYPSIDFVAQISGSATSRFHAKAGIKYSAVAEASVGLKSGGSFTKPTFTREITPPVVEATLSSEIKAGVGPRIKLLFWDTFGPSVSALGYGKLRANSEANPCFALDVGAELGVSLSLQIPWKLLKAEDLGALLGLDGDIFKKRFGPYELFSIPNVLSGSCGALPSNVYPPGEGPSEDVYKNPAFTPWSRRFKDDTTMLYQYPYSFDVPQTEIHAEKSIDGAWLASGRGIYGVFKLSEAGELRWASHVGIKPLDDREYEAERPATFATQARSTRLWVASSRFSLLELDQDGDLVAARRFVPKAPSGDAAGDALFKLGSQLDAVSVIEDDVGGLFVLYALQNTPNEGPAILVRTDARGDLVWARRIAFETSKTMLAVMARDGDDVILAGNTWEPGVQAARVLRVRGDGSLAWAKKLDVCANAYVRPGQLLRLASGAFALVGTYDYAPERSFILQMPADASSASLFAWDTNDALSDLRASQIAQLPTTGFVTASQIAPTIGAPIRLATHDAQGALVAGERELTFTTNAVVRSTFPGALRLTNDGGILLFAHSEELSDAPPALWVSKLPARTLEADFTGTPVTVSTPTSRAQPACTAAFSDHPLVLEPLDLRFVDVTDRVTVTKIAPRVETLLPKP